jgi:hypothetical protein
MTCALIRSDLRAAICVDPSGMAPDAGPDPRCHGVPIESLSDPLLALRASTSGAGPRDRLDERLACASGTTVFLCTG